MKGMNRMTTKKFDLHKMKKVDLVNKIIEMEKAHAGSSSLTDSQRREQGTENERVLAAVDGVTADKVAQEIAATSVKLTQQLSAVSEQLVDRTRQLEDVNKAVGLKREELERLHGAEVIQTAIEQQIQDFRTQERTNKQQQEEQRQAWMREQQQHEETQEELRTQEAKTRQRQKEEWAYGFQQDQKLEQQEWEDNQRERNLKENERQRELVRAWEDRERKLKEQEEEFTTLQGRVATFAEERDAEIKKQVAIATNTVKRDYTHQIEILSKEKETAQQISDAHIANLTEQNQKFQAEIEQLREHAASVDTRVSEIARAAITEAGSARALTEVTKLSQSTGGNGSSTPRGR
jgi:hypothetical protein